jgi:methyl-accepting chemotaxis protein
MILAMLAVLLLFALINGLLVYSIITDSDESSINEFNAMLRKDEKEAVTSWLNFAYTKYYPYVVLSRHHPDSAETYKNKALELLEQANEIPWSETQKYAGFYFIFNSKNGKIIVFNDSLGHIKTPPDSNAFQITDANKKEFVRDIQKRLFKKDSSVILFEYLKKESVPSVPSYMSGLAEGIYIEDWDWIIITGNYSEKLDKSSKIFAKKFAENRKNLMANLFGIMLVSFLVGLFMVFKQMNTFAIPMQNLSGYMHRLASEGLRFEDFSMDVNSQEEVKVIAEDLNSIMRKVGSLIETMHISADKISDLSCSCTDMLDIVDYDAKLVGQRTVEMLAYSEEVVDNVNGMALGIEEIYINLGSLKKLTSQVAENTTDVKNSISQISEAIKELNEKSQEMQNNVISVTQAVNDIGAASIEELNRINIISKFSINLQNELGEMASQTSALRRHITLKDMTNICNIADELHGRLTSIQMQLANLQSEQIIPYEQLLEGRKNLSKEIYSDTLNLNSYIGNIASHIANVNLSSQYINSNIGYMSNDINQAYSNLEEVVNSTNGMNENAKQAIIRMDEFSLKLKRVEDAHSAIEHTLVDAKEEMKNLNDLSASLRKVVNDMVRLDDGTAIKL